MFKKEDIERLLKEFIPWKYLDEYKLLMGGSLVMRGVRETTNDLDMDVSPELFGYLAELFSRDERDIEIVNGQRRFILKNTCGDVEVFEGTFKTDSGFGVRDVIDGIRCQTLGDIVKMKRHFGREKDFDDIIMIERWVLQNS